MPPPAQVRLLEEVNELRSQLQIDPLGKIRILHRGEV